MTLPSTLKHIGNYGFQTCKVLATFTFPESLTSIGNYAFSNCVALTEINLPYSLRTIGNNTFAACSSITGIKIPEGVESLGNSCFYNCGKLETVELPSTLTTYGTAVFNNSKYITKVIAHAAEPAALTDKVFHTDVFAAAKLQVQDASVDAYKAADVWKNFAYITGGATPTGVESVKVDNADDANAPYYDLKGVQIANPERGIYIHNGKKVMVK